VSIPHAPTGPGPTAEQRQAIDAVRTSVALSAGAGCGKTYVLTERFLSYFRPHDPSALQPADIGRLVAITFTERAAREMRDRIRRKCRERLAQASESEASYWAELLRGLDGARISTIHAFCGNLLRAHAVEAGVDPQFEMLEPSQAETLLAETIEDTLRRLLARRDDSAWRLTTHFDLNRLQEYLRDFVRDCGPQELEQWAQCGPEEQVERWRAFHQDYVVPQVARTVLESRECISIVEVLTDNVPEHPVMQQRRMILLEQFASLSQSAGDKRQLAAELQVILEHAKVQGGGTIKHWSDASAYERFRDSATKLRKLIDNTIQLLEFDFDRAQRAAELGAALLSVGHAVALEYARCKERLSALDFNDLLAKSRQLLTDSRYRDLQRRLAAQIHLLLVDEFQDTDPLQVELVAALCGDGLFAGKLFFVGDYKQSIYRFRGADPHVFKRLREDTPEAGQLSLTENFRSQPAILNFVNALFRTELGAGYEALKARRPQVSPQPAIEFLWAPAEKPKENVANLRWREADWVARRIRALIDGGEPLVWDADAERNEMPTARPARPGDVAILFRALSNVEVYEEALRRNSLDYYLVGGHAFYAQQEVFDLLNLLRSLDSPTDLVSLVGLLRSSFFSLQDETIFWLSMHPEGIVAGLDQRALPRECLAEQRERVEFAATTIGHLRRLKDRVRVCELIEEALALTGYDAALLNEFLGPRKLANLRKLIEQARAFQRGGFLGLADFIAQLAHFVAKQPDEPLAATHSENTNVVRLMTIHQSKGLEFPIVVIPDVDRKQQFHSPAVHFDHQLGPLVRVSETEDGEPVRGGYDMWRFREKHEEAAEMNRLLYVATTRAADYLLLSGGISDMDKPRGPWLELIKRHFDPDTGECRETRLPAGDVPAVKVTNSEPAVTAGGTGRRQRVDLPQVLQGVLAGATAIADLPPAILPVMPERGRAQYSFSRLVDDVAGHGAAREGAGRDRDPARDALGLGTLVHEVLAASDFSVQGDAAQIVRLVAERQSNVDPRTVAEASKLVARFYQSQRARAIAQSLEHHAEVEFLLAWPPSGAARSTTQLGGVIDCLYRDGEGWHLLDFKTNRVTAGEVAAVAAGYEMQMLVYALATEQILGVAPRSLTLHFLRTGDEFSFAWDAKARERVVKMVEASIIGESTAHAAVADRS